MDAFKELLDSTIAHLEELKRRGVRYVPASPELLRALSASTEGRTAAPKALQRPFAADLQRPTPPTQTPATPTPTTKAPTPRTPAEPIIVSMDHGKAAAIQQLRERALVCQKCPNLASSRKNVVFGVGSIDAELMFVGEAPGVDEDIQGEPFVGRAGQLLTRIIETMALKREQVYIANILKCRPDTPGQSYGNRAPNPEEM
ncbi:MAG TPA: uracil-DNA glycosylase, partial [Verrucomicrobiae bacterium]|nr:uracil-DNA glycosylase [Verrucomicrobiae bacterium]